MLKFLKKEANMTHTENGAVTYRSTQSECLDLFATIGALRRERDEEITNRFLRAYAEDADLAMKTLFFARDIRGGIGERRVFRTILKWLANNEPRSLEKNIQYIAEYGRYDDLLVLMGTTCEGKVLHLIKKQLAADCAALEAGVGPSFKLTHRSFEMEDMTIEFDESSQCYKIPVTGTVGYYRAVVTKLFKRSGQLHVTVGYIPTSSTDDSIINQSSDTPTKYMDYLFSRQSGSWYLTGLTDSETKPESADSAASAAEPAPLAESEVNDAILATAGDSAAASAVAEDPARRSS